jgi:hypothetical protein
VRGALQLQQLDQTLAYVRDGVVLARLLEECVVAQLSQLRSAGGLHQRAACRTDVLAGQQARPVAGEL